MSKMYLYKGKVITAGSSSTKKIGTLKNSGKVILGWNNNDSYEGYSTVTIGTYDGHGTIPKGAITFGDFANDNEPIVKINVPKLKKLGFKVIIEK